jgi:hypothetical protein
MIMAVQVATLDILTERGHFEPEVARAIGGAIEMEINHAKDPLATRTELFEVRDNLKREFEDFRSEVKREFAAVRAEMAHEFAAVRAEFKTECSLIRAEIQVAAANTKTEMMRFMFSALVGQTALILGIMYFMLRYLR